MNRRGSRWRNSLLDRLVLVQDNLCAGCGKPMIRRGEPKWHKPYDRPSIDNTLPRAKGGKSGRGNVTAMHSLCNSMKGDDMPTGCELIWLMAVNSRLGVEPQRP